MALTELLVMKARLQFALHLSVAMESELIISLPNEMTLTPLVAMVAVLHEQSNSILDVFTQILINEIYVKESEQLEIHVVMVSFMYLSNETI
jgi:hypothetical protein